MTPINTKNKKNLPCSGIQSPKLGFSTPLGTPLTFKVALLILENKSLSQSSNLQSRIKRVANSYVKSRGGTRKLDSKSKKGGRRQKSSSRFNSSSKQSYFDDPRTKRLKKELCDSNDTRNKIKSEIDSINLFQSSKIIKGKRKSIFPPSKINTTINSLNHSKFKQPPNVIDKGQDQELVASKEKDLVKNKLKKVLDLSKSKSQNKYKMKAIHLARKESRNFKSVYRSSMAHQKIKRNREKSSLTNNKPRQNIKGLPNKGPPSKDPQGNDNVVVNNYFNININKYDLKKSSDLDQSPLLITENIKKINEERGKRNNQNIRQLKRHRSGNLFSTSIQKSNQNSSSFRTSNVQNSSLEDNIISQSTNQTKVKVQDSRQGSVFKSTKLSFKSEIPSDLRHLKNNSRSPSTSKQYQSQRLRSSLSPQWKGKDKKSVKTSSKKSSTSNFSKYQSKCSNKDSMDFTSSIEFPHQSLNSNKLSLYEGHKSQIIFQKGDSSPSSPLLFYKKRTKKKDSKRGYNPEKAAKYYMNDLQQCLKFLHKPSHREFYQHFLALIKHLSLIKDSPSEKSRKINKIQNHIYLPPLRDGQKKTLILDLDETLIHCSSESTPDIENPSDNFSINIQSPEDGMQNLRVYKRPHLDQFLSQMRKYYQLVIFTSSGSSYANSIINRIDPDGEYFDFRVFQEHCIATQNGVLVKDLRVFANRDQKSVILVDNSALSFSNQLFNGVPILPFYGNSEDTELKKLMQFLLLVKDEKDIRSVNKQVFRMDLFKKFSERPDILRRMLTSSHL